jgi:hypothetical protein
MKKINFIICLIIIFSLRMNAQEFAISGNWEIGGSISYTNVTSVIDGESTESSLNELRLFVPIYNFIADGFEIGVVPSFEYYDFTNSSIIGLGIYWASAYNFNLDSNVFPYIEGRVGYNLISTSAAQDDVSLSGLGWSIIGGIKTHVGGNALITFGIGYAQQTLESGDYEGDRSGRNIIALSAGISLFFGDESRELKVN